MFFGNLFLKRPGLESHPGVRALFSTSQRDDWSEWSTPAWGVTPVFLWVSSQNLVSPQK